MALEIVLNKKEKEKCQKWFLGWAQKREKISEVGINDFRKGKEIKEEHVRSGI